MPASWAHPIAAIPFHRLGLPLAALVIGSMSPDGTYFLTERAPFHLVGHNAAGIAMFCIPAGVIAYVVFHLLLKHPCVALFPPTHQQKLRPLAIKPLPWSALFLLKVAIAVAVGAITHVAWDSCTHWYGWTVKEFPLLATKIIDTPLGPLRIYKVLQHGGTLVGTALLLYLYFRWLKLAKPDTSPTHLTLTTRTRRLTLACLCIMTLAAGLATSLSTVGLPDTFDQFTRFAIRNVQGGLAGLMLGVAIYAIAWHLTPSPFRGAGRGSG